MNGRSAFRTAALAVIVLAAAWVAYLLFSGGSDFTIFGKTISSHEPRRPLLILAVALTAWILTTHAAGPPARPRPVIRVDDRFVVGAIALIVLYVGVRYGTRTAGGADSYSYINQAQAWLRGPLRIQVPWNDVPWPFAAWTYAPFGYVPSHDERAIVPVVPPGLPLAMAGASVVGGYCAMFWVVPLFGAVLVVSTYGLGRRLHDSRTGLAAAALAAASPVFLYQLVQPMSDVPAASAWTLAFVLIFNRSVVSAAGAGLATAVALLIRPNLAPLAVLLPAWLAFKAYRADSAAERRARLAQIATFLAGASVAVFVLAFFNWQVHGSPGRSGYRDIGASFRVSNVPTNVKQYLAWFVQIETALPLAGLAVLAIPRVARWARAADSSFTLLLGAFVGLLVAQYLLYTPFDRWYYLRFLLPVFPLLAIALTLLIRQLSRSVPRGLGPFVAGLAIGGLVIRGVSVAAKERAFEDWAGEHRYVQIAQAVRDVTRPEDLVIAGQFAGAVKYYAGRETFNYNGLEPAWLDRAVAWFQERGVRVYLMADEWEVDDFRKRFAGEKTLSFLSGTPVLTVVGSAAAQLFDFQDGTRTQPTVRMKEVPPPRAECAMPAEPPPPVPRSR